MFRLSKKKIGKENCIVDYIIQTHAEQYSTDNKIRYYIDKDARDMEEKREMLESLDRYNTQLYEHPIFDKFKKRLLGDTKSQQTLTFIELSVCFLANTRKYAPEAIIDILWIDKERLSQLVQSLEAKLKKENVNLPRGYKAMLPTIQKFCSK